MAAQSAYCIFSDMYFYYKDLAAQSAYCCVFLCIATIDWPSHTKESEAVINMVVREIVPIAWFGGGNTASRANATEDRASVGHFFGRNSGQTSVGNDTHKYEVDVQPISHVEES